MNKTIEQPSTVQIDQPWFALNSDTEFSHFKLNNPSIISGYSVAVKGTSTILAVPDGCVDIIFDCDPDSPNAMVCGSTTTAQNTEFLKFHNYVGVRFYPGTFPDIIKVAPTELIDKRVNLLEILPSAESAIEQIANIGENNSKIELVNNLFKANNTALPSPLTQLILNKIILEKGNIHIKDLESIAGCSLRTIQRQFTHDLGMSPKLFCRIFRCQAAIQAINDGEQTAFTELAHNLGYSDHPHFIREFRKFVNTTPLDYQRMMQSSAK